jgi:hypothetical protein
MMCTWNDLAGHYDRISYTLLVAHVFISFKVDVISYDGNMFRFLLPTLAYAAATSSHQHQVPMIASGGCSVAHIY